ANRPLTDGRFASPGARVDRSAPNALQRGDRRHLMGAEARIIGGVVAGYLLGRGKKMRLALSMAGLLAGKQLTTDPKVIAKQLAELAETNPRLAELKGEVTGELMQAAQAAATAVLTQRMNTLSDTLRDRSDSLRGLAEEAE